MEQNTDTDDFDNDNYSVPGTSKPDRANDEINFDAMVQDLVLLDNTQPAANDSLTLNANVYQQQDAIQVFNSEDIQTVIANQAEMLKKLNIVVGKKNAYKLASLSIQLEETQALINQDKDRPVNVTLLQNELGAEENESFYITPIENQQQFEMFDTNLADKAQKKKLSKTLSLLCSSTVGSGTTCAYKLLDIIFTKDFLCKCSWSGGSKGEISKIPFKNYKNFRKFFFEIVNSWDWKFTDDDAEKFLKLALRNATKRKAIKGLRQSSKRTRRSRNSGNNGNRGEQLAELQAGNEDNSNNRQEPHQAGDENNSNNRQEPQAGDENNINNRQEPQAGDENNINNRQEPQAGDASNGNNRNEPQPVKNREQPEGGDNNEPCDDEKMDLC